MEEESLQNIIGEKHNYTQFGAKIGSLNFTFNLKPAILWKYKILVYWILPNGDVIVEKKNVDLKPCLPNKVHPDYLSVLLSQVSFRLPLDGLIVKFDPEQE